MPSPPPGISSQASELRRLLAQQEGVATRQQLLAHGVSGDAVRWNAGRHWRVLLPATYLLSRQDPTERQRLIAALAYAGPTSVLAAGTATRLHGISNGETSSRLVHVLVPAPKRSRRTGYVVVKRTSLGDDACVRQGLRVSSAARSCVDAALLTRRSDDRTALFIEAVQRRIVALDDLAEWVYRLRPRDAARLLPALDAAATGVWSLPEHELLTLIAGQRCLPEPWPNPHLLDADGHPMLTPDLWFDDVALAVMVHSRQFHANGRQFTDTIESDAELVAAGVVVVGVTPHGTRRDPQATLQRISRAYAVATARPRPPVRALPRAPHTPILVR